MLDAGPNPNAAVARSTAQCAGCGYDLRGDPAGVCPECGMTADDRERHIEAGKLRPREAVVVLIGWLLFMPLAVLAILAIALILAMALGG